MTDTPTNRGPPRRQTSNENEGDKPSGVLVYTIGLLWRG